MLLTGINHIATLTNDTDRLHHFYRTIFEATITLDMAQAPEGAGVRVSIIDIGGGTALNVFQIDDNTQADHQTPMFGRGRVDHFGLRASDINAFDTIRDRLISAGSADKFVTDFGQELSMFFQDPDGLEGEVLVANPDATPGTMNPPGTPAARYQ